MSTFQSFYGPKVFDGASWGRLRLDFSYTPETVTSATASVTVGARLWFETNDDVSDSSNTWAVSGDMGSDSGSATISHGSSGGATMLWEDLGVVFPLVYGATQVVDQAGSLTGINAIPGTFVVDADYVIPARPFAVPTAPSGVVASRNSDTSQTCTWTRNASTAGPYDSQKVQRRTFAAGAWGAWVTIATVAGTATSYTDTSTVADRAYEYRVQAVNTAGTSTSAASSTIKTTPAAPSGVAAAKSGANIVVTWTDNADAEDGYTVERRADAGAWGNAVTLAAGTTNWTHTSPAAGSVWQYRVKATTTTPALSSAWAESNTVQLAAAPNAPSGLGPSTVRDATEPVTLHWTHNPVDTSPQEAFQLRHRAVGSPTWTTVGPVVSAASEWTMPAGTYANPTAAEWQVSTKGQHASYSPWSATATLPASARPTATIGSPADESTVDTSALAVTWGYFDAEGAAQTAWELELLDDEGELVEVRSGVGAATSASLVTVLPDGSTWTLRARVQDAAGMWSLWDEATFAVAYALPPTPGVTLAWDPLEATITIEISVPDPVEGEADADHVDVWRAIDVGPWELIATGVPLATAVTDYSPTVAGVNRYRVDAVSALPSVAPSDVAEQETTDPRHVWVSGGPGFSQVCRVGAELDVKVAGGRAVRVLHQFAGREDLTEISGTTTGRELKLSAAIVDGTSEDWLALADLPGPHLWRDHKGRRVYVSLGTPDIVHVSPGLDRLSLSATRTGRA